MQKTTQEPLADLPGSLADNLDDDISGEDDFYSLLSSPTLPRSKTLLEILYKRIISFIISFVKEGKGARSSLENNIYNYLLWNCSVSIFRAFHGFSGQLEAGS